MLKLQKPRKLSAGDTVATVSLSWGGAGDEGLLWRYQVGKERLERDFGLHVIEMPHTLKGSSYVYHHPEKRAEDLMEAFLNPGIKAIFTCIGGDESIRMLPYIDFDIIRDNPKIFVGYSDTTITHLMCLKAGLSSFYGASVLAELAENIGIFPYTAAWLRQVLFDASPVGRIPAAPQWTGERIEWTLENKDVAKPMKENFGYEVLQGSGVFRGPLIGGCMEVLEMAKGTSLWPGPVAFEGSILFLETSEETTSPMYVERWLRGYGSMGILRRIKGILFGKPYQEVHYTAYKDVIRSVLAEYDLTDLPVVCNMSFGHNEPMCVLPYGAMGEFDCTSGTFSILDAGVEA